MAAKKPSKWRCHCCGNRNKDNVTKCPKCNTEKTNTRKKKKVKSKKKKQKSNTKSNVVDNTLNVKKAEPSPPPANDPMHINDSKPSVSVTSIITQPAIARQYPQYKYMLVAECDPNQHVREQCRKQHISLSELQFEEESTSIVIDVGSYATKAGFCASDSFQIYACRHDIEFIENKYPIGDQGEIHWHQWTSLLHDILYRKLRVQPEECPILMTEPPLNPKVNREKVTQIIFENFNVPSFYLGIKSVLGLYAYAKTTGMVIDSGYDRTYFVPVYEGYALPERIEKIPVGGKHVTERLMKYLPFKSPDKSMIISGFYNDLQRFRGGIAMNDDAFVNLTNAYFGRNTTIFDIADVIKRKYGSIMDYGLGNRCYLPDETGEEYQIAKLPDGTCIEIQKKHLMECVEETMFSKQGYYQCHFGEVWGRVQMKCDCDIRRELRENTVLVGGNTLFPQMEKRMSEEMRHRGPVEIHRCYGKEEREFMSWIGGSILASLNTFHDMWICADEYEESGAGIVHRKCF
eukprot:906138_1